jgi:hypothetical protein
LQQLNSKKNHETRNFPSLSVSSTVSLLSLPRPFGFTKKSSEWSGENNSATVDGYQYGYAPQNSVSDLNANAQIIAAGNRGTSLYCSFISSRSVMNPHGNGVCQDQNRINWNMMF